MVELKFKRKTGWDGPDLDRATERRAAEISLKILAELQAVFKKSAETKQAPDWIYDLGKLDADSAAFLTHALGKGEVRISLHSGEVKACETSIPGLWLLEIGPLKSLVAALLPRSVEVAIAGGAERVMLPEKQPAGLFAAPAILTEINDALAQTDVSRTDPDNVPRQIDLIRQPLTPADRTFILTSIGEGPVSIELSGFAESRIFSTKVRGLWRTVIINNNHKVLLESLSVTHVPPEVPASLDDMAHSAKLVYDTIAWIEHDLARDAPAQDKKE